MKGLLIEPLLKFNQGVLATGINFKTGLDESFVGLICPAVIMTFLKKRLNTRSQVLRLSARLQPSIEPENQEDTQ